MAALDPKTDPSRRSHERGACSRWLTEMIAPDLLTVNGIREVYHSTSSPFQEIDVYRLGSFGRCLVLDGKIQSSMVDEHIYHECLVQPAMALHPNPRMVLVAGGGEGATARELLRSNTVEQCTMVDIDKLVVDTCRLYLPEHSAGAFDDPRLVLHICDAGEYIQALPDGSIDVLILDLADPTEEGPCHQLYTREFYSSVAKKLAPDGVLVTQAGPAGLVTAPHVFYPVVNTLKTVFEYVQPYSVFVPSFLDLYGFAMCSNDIDVRHAESQAIDQRIAQRMEPSALRFYDATAHLGITSLSKDLRQQLEATKDQIISLASPAFMFSP